MTAETNGNAGTDFDLSILGNDTVMIVGENGQPQVMPASAKPWWEYEEDAKRQEFERKAMPIHIKTFEC